MQYQYGQWVIYASFTSSDRILIAIWLADDPVPESHLSIYFSDQLWY